MVSGVRNETPVSEVVADMRRFLARWVRADAQLAGVRMLREEKCAVGCWQYATLDESALAAADDVDQITVWSQRLRVHTSTGSSYATCKRVTHVYTLRGSLLFF